MNFPTLIEETNPRTEILKEAQIQSGIVEDYYDEFVVWGIRHLGLEDKVRVILLDKAKPTDTVN
jgi:hypothetical protein